MMLCLLAGTIEAAIQWKQATVNIMCLLSAAYTEAWGNVDSSKLAPCNIRHNVRTCYCHRIIVCLFVLQIYGSMYYKVGQVSVPASIGSVQNVLGVLYSSGSFLGNINLMSAMPVFAMERGVSAGMPVVP